MDKVPKLRFKEFNGEWEEKRLGDIFKIFNGYAFSSKSNINDGIILLKIANVGINKMVKNEMSFLPMDFLELYSKYLLKKGDIVIALTRPLLDKKLKIAEIDDFFNNSLLNQRVGKILSEQNKKFIYNLLQNSKYIKKIEDSISGTDPPNLSTETIKDINIIIPKLEEQEKIANFLSSVDKKISIAEEKLNLFNQYKKGIMQKIFNQELRFKDENGNNYPQWEEKKLEKIADCLDNKRKPLNSTEREKIKGNIPYYGANGIQGYINNFLFDEELVLLAEDGGNFEDFSIKPIAQYICGKSWVNNHAHILKGKKETLTKFLFYSLVHKDIRNFINGTSRSKLNKSDMLNIIINLPCIEEQKKIADFLSAIDDKIENISDNLESLKLFKKSMLQKMFV